MDIVRQEGGCGDVFGAEIVDQTAGEEAGGPDPEGSFGMRQVRHCGGFERG